MASFVGDRNRRKATVKYAKSAQNTGRIAIPKLYHNVLGNMCPEIKKHLFYNSINPSSIELCDPFPSFLPLWQRKGIQRLILFVLFYVNTLVLRSSWKYFFPVKMMIQILMTARLSNKSTPRTEELPEVSKAKTSFIDKLIFNGMEFPLLLCLQNDHFLHFCILKILQLNKMMLVLLQ